ncbi:hypothetical protein CMUC_1066 [Campylobacter mucosalis CCUG 21559]|uniref:Uncharacterized protein n=1 Tax=Campylobacter mucosalis CCUG 21559 TaxID=1032067 RepID=A0A6G5QGZ5_9BACT|nr:hypothetical protein CMUC_1066 [Campylobacter mucosalis CCUG 21559]
MRYLVAILFSVLSFATPYDLAKAYAQYYFKALPMRIDDYFSLTALLDVGDELYYHYKVNDTARLVILQMSSEQIETYKKSLKKTNEDRLCKDERVIAMLNGGIKLHHLFYRETGARLLFEFVIDKRSCKI